ncbi:unnamed protein product [Mytilus coruscus]|uniref:DDE Tnp4 domain-containing protein n=1 Tax=Mytilus coruscus TaxID=42192 RepID=A0A6J8C8T2_MYTCO|nr:unnamed protein product [Mytilus coruscus]
MVPDSDSDMEITKLDTTLESEPGTSTSSEKLPEAICSLNVLEASSTVGTQYLESDFLPQTDHIYGKEWTDFQTRFSQILTEEKGVQSKSDGATTCIIDCAETFIQRPTNLRSRGETYSNYKSHKTAKHLVEISPHAQIMFISKAFGGRASDKFIVEKSGFINYLLPGVEIMADRGFTIDDLFFPLRVKLNIPAFTKNKPQLSAEDVTTTRRIARVQIHVERVIRRLKVFKILSGTVHVSSLKLFDDILLVCSALVNLRSYLIRDTNESDE